MSLHFKSLSKTFLTFSLSYSLIFSQSIIAEKEANKDQEERFFFYEIFCSLGVFSGLAALYSYFPQSESEEEDGSPEKLKDEKEDEGPSDKPEKEKKKKKKRKKSRRSGNNEESEESSSSACQLIECNRGACQYCTSVQGVLKIVNKAMSTKSKCEGAIDGRRQKLKPSPQDLREIQDAIRAAEDLLEKIFVTGKYIHKERGQVLELKTKLEELKKKEETKFSVQSF